MDNVGILHHPTPLCTCGEHLLQVQYCMDQGLCAHCLACSSLQSSQGSPCQDAAGACKTQRRAPVMNHFCSAPHHPSFCCTEARDRDHKQD